MTFKLQEESKLLCRRCKKRQSEAGRFACKDKNGNPIVQINDNYPSKNIHGRQKNNGYLYFTLGHAISYNRSKEVCSAWS
jgi:hypothetical protein